MQLRAEFMFEVGGFKVFFDLFHWNVKWYGGPWFYGLGLGPLAVGWGLPR